jgi:hypothetical protein
LFFFILPAKITNKNLISFFIPFSMRLTLTHHKENIGKISQQFGSKIALIMTGISSTQCLGRKRKTNDYKY